MPALQIDTPALSVPAQRISLFWYPTGKCIRNGGRDTLKANECFLSDVPPGKKCADRMGDSPPGKECADRMGDSPPGRRGREEVQCRRQEIRQRENSISRRKQPEKKRGIANVRKNSGSYMQSIYAENSVAGAKNFRKNF